jgi:hypothetical protein
MIESTIDVDICERSPGPPVAGELAARNAPVGASAR